jgi:hypothetical protein
MSINDHYWAMETINAQTPTAIRNHMRVLDQLDEGNQVRVLLAVSAAAEEQAKQLTISNIRANKVNRKAGWNMHTAAYLWGVSRQTMVARWGRWTRKTTPRSTSNQRPPANLIDLFHTQGDSDGIPA